ncbi:MAG: hypothetical protein ACLPX7_20020 [Xanthobacteraceae bacterium]
MPIYEADPWRLQYFAQVETAANITTEDADAWQWYPAHRWVYDKLAVALSQGLDAGPHGTPPPRFPVFSKPIVNLKGMGAGSRVLHSQADYDRHYAPGHFWMTLLEGRHVSSDLAVVEGEPRWWRHVTGKPAGEGTFDYWTVHAEADAEIESRAGAWVRKHLTSYTGMLNLETIDAAIIEAHLRFADQWPDLYGAGWVNAVVRLYETGTWEFADADRKGGYSVVLFGPGGIHYRRPPQALLDEIKHTPGITSVQVTFHEDLPPERHSMPPGGFRLAVVNGVDLAAALAARERLKGHFLAVALPNRDGRSGQVLS